MFLWGWAFAIRRLEYSRNCKTCENIDGDTFVSGPSRVRLFGIDAPEVGQRCATEATTRLDGQRRDWLGGVEQRAREQGD